MSAINQLKEEFTEIRRLQYITALLQWDTQVNLPPGSYNGRSEQVSIMEKMIHEKLISDIDIAILGQPQEIYESYADAVRLLRQLQTNDRAG